MKFGIISLSALTLACLPAAAMAGQYSSTQATGYGYSQSGSTAVVAPNTTYNSYTPSTETLRDNTQAPDVVVSGANQCALPIGASTSILGVGLGLAATPTDEGCEHRNDANALLALGLRPESIALMCEQKDVRKAMEGAGTTCAQVIKTAFDAQAQQAAAPIVAPASVEIVIPAKPHIIVAHRYARKAPASAFCQEVSSRDHKDALQLKEDAPYAFQCKTNMHLND